MVREAEANAEEDRRRREEIEERNRADSLAYQAEKIVRESGDKLPAELRTEVEEKTKTLREALAGTDAAAIRDGMQELQSALERAGQAVYAAQEATSGNGEAGGNQGQPGATGGRPGTVEGEYREV